MSHRIVSRPLVLALVAALGLQSGTPAWAAAELSDLVGARGSSGEVQLERRGFTHVDGYKYQSKAYTYWWSNADSRCVRVTTADGRYQAIVDADASDCGQTKKESGLSDGAKVAIGAAALLGIAALVHKSHHRDDRRFDERQTAEFERGYRDGLYHNSFHNHDDSREYADGFEKGVEERRHQSGYRNGHGWGGASWMPCANEGSHCGFQGSGVVRYGVNGKYVTRRASNGLRCETRSFGDDPAYGERKECWVRLDGR